jgi:hypothetical protein
MRRPTNRPAMNHEATEAAKTKRLYIVISGGNHDKRNHLATKPARISDAKKPDDCGPGCTACERIAYERIAKSLSLTKRN